MLIGGDVVYCAIIGDIIGSRNIEERSSVQKNLKKILDKINDEYRSEIASRFTITIGDEFQGLIRSTKYLLKIIDTIKMEFYPNMLRFGVGFGIMYTEIIEEVSIGSDGPAYYAARKAIDEIKYSNNKYEQPDRDILIYDDNKISNEKYDLINATLSLCRVIEKGWTQKQREVIVEMFYTNKSQRSLAEELGVKQSSIHRRLNSGNYFTYKNAKEKIDRYINYMWESYYDK